MDKSIGFIGFGEASYQICRGFKEDNLDGIGAYDVLLSSGTEAQINALKNRAAETSVRLINDLPELLGADIVFVAVPAKHAESVVTQALPFLRPGQLIADITTNRPQIKLRLGQLLEEKGALYADASVMGAVPLYKHRTPTIVSGNGARKMIELLGPLGMDLTFVGLEPGRAVKMKLTRSVFIKGIEAITLEMLLTARQLGIEDEIMEGLQKSFDTQGFTKLVGQLVTSNTIHAARRSIEAEECMELIEDSGFDPVMMEATKRKLRWSADLGYSKMNPPPKCATLKELYALWDELGIIQPTPA
ncbi:MAG: DUF1932 domain-containing protein [Deltaproteobacteria bacterium]|jgi:3-hydroxyisobutyrate dehydrogenase-like beta-hydroxyacid dehydrogenase|nr:DUF1932 domain-containing protein [Deltaproteobacteria bacterium]